MISENQHQRYELIKAQSDFETAVMELYYQFAVDYVYCSLWSILAQEEKKHSSWLKGLAAKLKDEEVDYEKCTFQKEKLLKAVTAIREFIEKIRLKPLPISEAFSYAERIENSIYEKEYLTSFDTDSEYLKNTIGLLIEESGIHRDMIIEEAAKYKFGSY